MGEIKGLICNQCKEEWMLYLGTGFTGVNFYCDSCNKLYQVNEITSHNSTLSSETLHKCNCGGTFVEEPLQFICPKCKSRDVSSSGIEGLWD